MLLNKADFKLFESVVQAHDKFVIIPHYNPDPDAIGSSFAMKELLTKGFGKDAIIAYSGIIGRAENSQMVECLKIDMTNITDLIRNEGIDNSHNTAIPEGAIILMDTQPGSGNNPLGTEDIPVIVIDHHPIREQTRSENVAYADVRTEEHKNGSSGTIMCEYLEHFKVKITPNLATALYYGIDTDVTGESREGFDSDFHRREQLRPILNKDKLSQIISPKLPFDYYTHITKGMENCMVYGDFLFSTLGEINNPDYVSEIADFLIRYERAEMVLMIGIHNDSILMSLRAPRRKYDAGEIIREIVGNMGSAGGHQANAGGKIIFKDKSVIKKTVKKIIKNALIVIAKKEGRQQLPDGIPFLSQNDYMPIMEDSET
ncbi:MAG: DHH family phosphoesterase [Spirochaetales bacterium]|nr:DHH family phosphoesterase [Spirochaetales bacterium]